MSDSAFAPLPEGGRRLNIFVNQNLLGTLHEDKDLWALAYDPTWVDREGSFDLSPALPRSQLLHRDGATSRPVQWYFDNLLPEEKLRELIAGDARLQDKDDAFALLAYLGAESAGSLTLLPPGQTPDEHATLKPLSYEALSRRIAGLPKTTLTKEAPKRMSLAGAQHKLLVVLKGQDLYEPVGSTPSTHILKPDHPDSASYPASSYLEWLTMRLAKAARLNVPPVHLLRVPQPVYAIERFDRRLTAHDMRADTGVVPAAVERLHVIDACQLLNKSRVFKHSGASVQALREVVLTCGDELTLPVKLFRWLVFNLLVGNDDCHLKNLSFLVTAGRVELSPHYDLLATGVYHTRAFADERATWPAVPLAVRLSEQVRQFDQVTPHEVLHAAEVLGVPASVAVRVINEVVRRTLREFDAVYTSHYPQTQGLLNELTQRGLKKQAQMPAPLIDAQADIASEADGGQTQDTSANRLVQAQQLKVLRVLRYMVLSEMAQRLLGD